MLCGAWLRRTGVGVVMHIMDDRPILIGGRRSPRCRFNRLELFCLFRRKAFGAKGPLVQSKAPPPLEKWSVIMFWWLVVVRLAILAILIPDKMPAHVSWKKQLLIGKLSNGNPWQRPTPLPYGRAFRTFRAYPSGLPGGMDGAMWTYGVLVVKPGNLIPVGF